VSVTDAVPAVIEEPLVGVVGPSACACVQPAQVAVTESVVVVESLVLVSVLPVESIIRTLNLYVVAGLNPVTV